MSNTSTAPIRSPSYPNMPLREAVAAVAKIEALYRSAPVDRTVAVKLLGYSSLSGPANKALSALASYGLLERAAKGEARVTARARAILHASSDEERRENLLAAASEPDLFRELRERFEGLSVFPEDGVMQHLNRRGFNPNAVRPAAKAFLQTMEYVEELRESESHVPKPSEALDSPTSDGNRHKTFGGAKIGDLIQWESQGAFQLPKPLRVRFVSDDGKWVAVEGSQKGIPMSEVLLEARAADAAKPPLFPFSEEDQAAPTGGLGEVEWMRNRLGNDVNVRLMVKGDMGPKEIGKLIRLLEAQKLVLEDD